MRSTDWLWRSTLPLETASSRAVSPASVRTEPLPTAQGPQSQVPRLAWTVGVITAPRKHPTIHRTLKSLHAAGFDSAHLFAEPGSWIPKEFRRFPVTVHGRALGNLGNFFSSLVALYFADPHAECYAIFQDDVELAEGLRSWCDGQFWPQNVGLVSLFTSRVYSGEEVGWRVLKLGHYRTFGAQALVFRRDVLEEFVKDGAALRYSMTRAVFDDAVLGEWATRAGIGIAYHTPSLVQHIGAAAAIRGRGHGIGRASVADAVASVAQIPLWRPPQKRPARIGLMGWNTPSGVGYMNRDIAGQLPIAKWLVPEHPGFPTLTNPPADCRIDRVPRDVSPEKIRAWLKGLDWVLFVEVPHIQFFAQYAREQEISVACIPMWEYANHKLDWMNYVDLMICPTRFTYELLADWNRRFGFAWDLVYVPWPIDTRRFCFRRREVCRKYLFVNGTGGSFAQRLDGSLTEYRRKGIEVLFEAARLVPQIPFVVYSQTEDMPRVPQNVNLRKGRPGNDDLYQDGDICVQPSHWEGMGLQLMECQAAGVPLVTTDAPPMNEFRPLRSIPVAATEVVSVFGDHPMISNRIDPADLARVLEELYGTEIGQASEDARKFIVEEHSWEKAIRLITQAMRA